MRLTRAQKRVMATLWSGGLIRRRGAFGGFVAPSSDGRFAHSRTIDCLWRAGLIRPAPYWGAFEAVPRRSE